jgi:hypothetical protein
LRNPFEELRRRLGVAPALHEDVERVAILADRTREIVLLATDMDEYLVHEPYVAPSWLAALQSVGEHSNLVGAGASCGCSRS